MCCGLPLLVLRKREEGLWKGAKNMERESAAPCWQHGGGLDGREEACHDGRKK